MQPNPESCDLETNIPLLVRKEEYAWWSEVSQLTYITQNQTWKFETGGNASKNFVCDHMHVFVSTEHFHFQRPVYSFSL